jgi:hypothetical protein
MSLMGEKRHMEVTNLVASIGGLIGWGAVLVFASFLSLAFKKTDINLIGVTISAESAHLILGPLLVIVNTAVFMMTAILSRLTISPDDLKQLQSKHILEYLGPILNPFFVSDNQIINSLGYMFLIVLWWIGQYTFLYSVELNLDSPFLYAWKLLISALYLAIGLISMLMIQQCWINFGMAAYKTKYYVGFLGIIIGAGLPPVLTGRGFPKLL